MSAFSVRTYRQGDECRIVTAFEEAFGEARGLEEWRWRFRFEGRSPCIALGQTEGGEVVSQYAAIPMRLEIDGVALGAGQPVDVFCLRRPGSAEGGLYVRTYRRFVKSFCGRQRPFQVLFGFPHDRVLRQGQLKMGYPSDPPPVPAWTLPIAGKVRSLVRRAVPPLAPSGERWTGDEMDRLWQRCRRRYPVAAVRDGHWLERRFASRPGVRYQHLVVRRDGEPRAWAALRRVGWEMRWADLLWDGSRAADLEALSRRARELARRAGRRRLVLWLAGDDEAAAVLERIGFRPRAGQELFFAHRFYDRGVAGAEEFARRFYVTLGISDLV